MLSRLKYYAGYIWALRRWFALALLTGLLSAATSGLGLPLIIYKVFPAVFDPSTMPVPVVEFLQKYVPADELQAWILFAACIVMPLAFIVRGLAMWINSMAVNYFGLRLLEHVRIDVFQHLQQLPLAFHEGTRRGDILSRIVTDAQNVQQMIMLVSSDIMKQPFTAVAAMAALVYIALDKSQAGTFIIVLIFVVVTILPIVIFGLRIIKKAKTAQENLGKLNAIVNENLAAQREIRSYGMEAAQTAQLAEVSGKFCRAQLKTIKYQKIVSPLLELLTAIALAILLVVGRLSDVTLSDFMAIAGALFFACDAIRRTAISVGQFNAAQPSLSRIEAILNEPNNLRDPANPKAFPRGNDALEIRFENVDFSYKSATGTVFAAENSQKTLHSSPLTLNSKTVPALRDVSLEIPPEQIVAIVGPSGAGKTTFISLIERFYDVDRGNVFVGGNDVRDVLKKDLHEKIALVSQHILLFRDTIRENIRLGRPSATNAEVDAAVRDAQLEDLLKSFPQGLDTMLKEGGENLSGGQRQRIAIARAFLKNAPILILDEATSALDNTTETRIQESLARLAVGKTTLIIAHRFSSIRLAHRILVFANGHILGDGPHASLYATCPLYRELYDAANLKNSSKNG